MLSKRSTTDPYLQLCILLPYCPFPFLRTPEIQSAGRKHTGPKYCEQLLKGTLLKAFLSSKAQFSRYSGYQFLWLRTSYYKTHVNSHRGLASDGDLLGQKRHACIKADVSRKTVRSKLSPASEEERRISVYSIPPSITYALF